MNNEQNIDKLLKESFENFSPEAPDVWQAVQQGVQAAQASAAVSSGAGAVVAQGVSLTVKIVAGIAIAAASVAGYVLYNEQSDKQTAKITDPVVQEQVLPEADPGTENSLPVKKEVVSPAPVKTHTASANHSNGSSPANRNSQEEKENVSSITGISGTGVSEIQNEEPLPVASVKEKPQTNETPKSVTKVTITETTKAEMVKPAGRGSAEKPYNPYAEEGEEFEKPKIPGSFSPNDDGVNDKFEILIENESYYLLRVLNEKGEIVFESSNRGQLWDGKHYKTGQVCAKGNYMYILNYQYKGSDKPHEASGLVRLFF